MIAAMLIGLSAVLFKKSLMGRNISGALRSVWFWLGAAANVAGMAALTVELSSSAVSKAVPLLAQSYFVIVPLSVFWLKEKIGRRDLIGLLLVLGGSLLI